ncbi:uncharacterized protein LOC110695549 isoform X2 [Chenopodium quinoa]|uniref:uncharacterized protein LOC110695549 isoform X2 n=1 Tax=Chenopodium quinoa TaxID=63459 RepID=UPI000B77961B|nr:uncharacterized protein LOC110695549 isoform X2 [Chenopodium quinoa]
MFSHGGKTPSRYELLSMVKKHSNLLGKTIVDEQDASDVELDQAFWHDILNFYFVQGKQSRGRQDDDLIFFVRKMNIHAHNSSDDLNANSPYFVRRWASKLDSMVGDSLMEVDWRRSFYLNLIAHTSFTVTVAICSNQVLQHHRVGQDTKLSPIYKVVKTVYASPSRVNFHLDSRKEAETFPAYPDICFAIDDFDSTFDTVVLSDADHCYCVVLNAHAGAAFPSEMPENEVSDKSPKTEDSGTNNKTKVTIFSGFVSYQMVRDAYDGRNRFGSLLSFSHSSGKLDRIYMKGPGGRGEVEVAVSGVEVNMVLTSPKTEYKCTTLSFLGIGKNFLDQSQHSSRPSSPVESKSGFGFATIVRRAASAASVAAKQAYAAASNNSDDEMLPLNCSLMSVSLPWEHIAHDLLFKGGPPVSM